MHLTEAEDIKKRWQEYTDPIRSVAQSCPTLCNPMNYKVHRILQATILEWVAVPFSRGSSNPGIKPRSPTLQADSLPTEPQGKPKNTSPVDLLDPGIKPGGLQVDSLPTELSGTP